MVRDVAGGQGAHQTRLADGDKLAELTQEAGPGQNLLRVTILHAAAHDRMSRPLGSNNLSQPIWGCGTVGVQAGDDLSTRVGDGHVASGAGVGLLVTVNEMDLGKRLRDEGWRFVARTVYHDHFIGFAKILGHDRRKGGPDGGGGVVGRDDNGDNRHGLLSIGGCLNFQDRKDVLRQLGHLVVASWADQSRRQETRPAMGARATDHGIAFPIVAPISR